MNTLYFSSTNKFYITSTGHLHVPNTLSIHECRYLLEQLPQFIEELEDFLESKRLNKIEELESELKKLREASPQNPLKVSIEDFYTKCDHRFYRYMVAPYGSEWHCQKCHYVTFSNPVI